MNEIKRRNDQLLPLERPLISDQLSVLRLWLVHLVLANSTNAPFATHSRERRAGIAHHYTYILERHTNVLPKDDESDDKQESVNIAKCTFDEITRVCGARVVNHHTR